MKIKPDKKFIYFRFLLLIFLSYLLYILISLFLKYNFSILIFILISFVINLFFVTKIEKKDDNIIFRNIFNIPIKKLSTKSLKYKIKKREELDWKYTIPQSFFLGKNYKHCFYIKLMDENKTIGFNNLILDNKSKEFIKQIIK